MLCGNYSFCSSEGVITDYDVQRVNRKTSFDKVMEDNTNICQ